MKLTGKNYGFRRRVDRCQRPYRLIDAAPLDYPVNEPKSYGLYAFLEKVLRAEFDKCNDQRI